MGDVELCLIRHAESRWNAVGLWQGQGDPSLSARGEAQARSVARRLRPQGLELVVSSDLERAQRTAAAISSAAACPLRVEPLFRERDLGAWSGRSAAEIAERWPEELRALRLGDPGLRPGGGESRRELLRRLARALEGLALSPARRIAVVTHLGVLSQLQPGYRPAHAEVRCTTLRACQAALRKAQGRDRSAMPDAVRL